MPRPSDAPTRDSVPPKLSRYDVVRRLGDGGMGVVYEAIDREHGARVALKTLHRFDAETLLYLKQEFRALQDLQHPNLVRLGELMREGDTWFFTMELVEGTDLFGYLEVRAERPSQRTEAVTMRRAPASADASGEHEAHLSLATFHEERVRRTFVQLAEALSALHAAGKVHRDVKPSNVLVTHDGRVVLVDFGLILDDAIEAEDARIVGTARYMAPEQAMHQGVGPAADWYAFGVALFECVTGRSPFEGSGARVLERKVVEDAPRASMVAAHVPRELDELCARLLDRDPGKRPGGAEVIARLRGEGRRSSETRRVGRMPFVGREAELAALRAAFERARAGETLAVVVEGESGLGKSALARRFVRELAAEGDAALVLAGRCYEREVVPYKALDGVMDALCQHLAPLDDAAVAALVPAGAWLIAQAFPVMRRLARFDIAARQRRSRPDFSTHESRGRFFETVRDLFERLAKQRTLVLLVDDLHWADADSLALLAELLRPPSPPRMLLLATARPGARFDLPGAVENLPLARLDASHALTLARAALGGARDDDASAIAKEADGHPLFVVELTRHALDAGDAPLASAPHLRLDEALAARAARLEPDARTLLEVLAVAGLALAREPAMRAAALDFDAFARASSALRAAHLARAARARGDGALEPYHDRVREAVVAALPDDELRARHRGLAAALEADAAADPDQLATHWLEAGEPARAAAPAKLAAEKAFEALAYDRAATLFARAIPLAATEVERNALRERMGESLASAGRGAEAARAFVDAAAAKTGEPALDLRRRAAEELLLAGQIEPGMAALRDVLARIGMRMPGPLVAVLLLLATRAYLALRGYRATVRPKGEVPRHALLRMDACGSVARALAFIDPLLSAYYQTKLLRLALVWGEPYRLAYALALEAGWIATRGVRTRARADAMFERAAAVSSACEEPYVGGLLLGTRAFGAMVQGRLREAIEQADRALAIVEGAPGLFWELRSMQSTAIWALSATGELAQMAQRVLPMLREAEDRGDVMTQTVLRTGNAIWLWLRKGDAAAARASAEGALHQWTPRSYHHQHWWGTVALSQVDLYEGKGADAWARVSGDWPRARRALLFGIELLHFDARHLRARAAILAAAEAEGAAREALLRHAEADARWFERRGPPYGAPWVLHLRACIAAVRGDREACIAGLSAAAPDFDRTPVPLWAAATRWQLARLTTGEVSRGHADAARAFWDANDVVDPDRMSAVFVPGVSLLAPHAG